MFCCSTSVPSFVRCYATKLFRQPLKKQMQTQQQQQKMTTVEKKKQQQLQQQPIFKQEELDSFFFAPHHEVFYDTNNTATVQIIPKKNNRQWEIFDAIEKEFFEQTSQFQMDKDPFFNMFESVQQEQSKQQLQENIELQIQQILKFDWAQEFQIQKLGLSTTETLTNTQFSAMKNTYYLQVKKNQQVQKFDCVVQVNLLDKTNFEISSIQLRDLKTNLIRNVAAQSIEAVKNATNTCRGSEEIEECEFECVSSNKKLV